MTALFFALALLGPTHLGWSNGQSVRPYGAPAGCFVVEYDGGYGCASGFALVPQRGPVPYIQTVWTLGWTS